MATGRRVGRSLCGYPCPGRLTVGVGRDPAALRARAQGRAFALGRSVTKRAGLRFAISNGLRPPALRESGGGAANARMHDGASARLPYTEGPHRPP